MAGYNENHFYTQFDNFPEGEARFKAAARHATMLLNRLDNQEFSERAALIDIRNALMNGVNSTKIALAIQERLHNKLETQGDLPIISELHKL